MLSNNRCKTLFQCLFRTTSPDLVCPSQNYSTLPSITHNYRLINNSRIHLASTGPVGWPIKHLQIHEIQARSNTWTPCFRLAVWGSPMEEQVTRFGRGVFGRGTTRSTVCDLIENSTHARGVHYSGWIDAARSSVQPAGHVAISPLIHVDYTRDCN